MGATQLWLVRHGESRANVAATRAERAGLPSIEVDHRDADVPLSDTGIEQATALGAWLTENVDPADPPRVFASSYLRAQQTIGIALESADLALPVAIDERLRDRELGILDLLTSVGVEEQYPLEAARRRWLGKFYYRPPGGEAWTDVALRVRSFLHDLDLAEDDGTVLVTAHDAVVMVFLYVCQGLTEAELLDFTRTNTVTNASVTQLVRPSGSGRWELRAFSQEDHLRASEVPVTEHPGDKNAEIH